MAYTQVTLAELRTAVKGKVESVPYWSDSDANAAIAEALRVWNLLTGQFKVRDTTTETTANQTWYNTPTGMLYPFRITYTSFVLEPTSTFDLDYAKGNWQGDAAGDTDRPSRPVQWAPCGINRFCIWPASAVGAIQLAIDGVQQAPIPATDSDYVNLGREEQAAIVDYAFHQLMFKEGGPRFQASQANFQSFIMAAGARNARLNAATFYRAALRGHDLSREQKPLMVQPAQAGA